MIAALIKTAIGRGSVPAESSVGQDPDPAEVSLHRPTPSVLDPGRLEKLSVMIGDAQIFAELIESFLTDMPQLLTTMRQSLEEGDVSGVRTIAHTLKSESADFGAMTLSGLCKQSEIMGKAGTLEGADKLITQVEVEYARVKEALEALYAEKNM